MILIDKSPLENRIYFNKAVGIIPAKEYTYNILMVSYWNKDSLVNLQFTKNTYKRNDLHK